jgi:flavin prenyltransferase
LKTASQRLIVGISGASGIAYGVRLLELVQDTEIETHLVLSKGAQVTLVSELDRRISEIQALADVVLKERRRLVLLVRETPFHLGHLRNMTAVTEMGAIVYPPVPALYAKPKTIDAMIDHTLGRVLDLFDIDVGTAHRWVGVRETVRPPTFVPP